MKMGNRTRLLTATALVASGIFSSQVVFAQDASPASAPASPQEAESSASTGDIVVTGTRVVRDGYQAPNPVSVIGEQQIAAKAPVNLADYVNQIPALASSATARNSTPSISNGTAGINALNLRNLGVNRTLVLLDGQRVGAASLQGWVDINGFPQSLVKRVDIVTGGASADWGSDAVAGVVNFVLDRTFKGVKGEAQGGVTTYGDDRNYKLSLTAGTDFADGRGHILIAGELAHSDGVTGFGGRDWYKYRKVITNPDYTATNGQPRLVVRDNTGFNNATPGGIITSGPLRGIYFDEGGTPKQFNYGPIIGGNFMNGGQYQYADWAKTGDLAPEQGRQNIFARASFELTDHFEVFAQFSFARATTGIAFGTLPRYGNISINSDNAFLPASVAAQAAALGVTSFNMGSFVYDIGPVISNTRRTNYRPVIGARGDFDALGSNWTWDIYGQETITHSYGEIKIPITANWLRAIDAVRAPNGTIVCRSTLSDPTNGCVPFSVFGTGVNSQAAVDYVKGTAWFRQNLKQRVVAANLRGNPFSTWAGPVSVALGIENRRESVSGTVDALDAASLAQAQATGAARVLPYQTGNYLPSFGSYTVTEGYLQTVVPLAKDSAFAKSLDLLAGVRGTNYSTSGYVTTWKAGLTYKPIDDITFRVTRSRDIRAPNLAEYFQQQQAGSATITDPLRGFAQTTIFQITSGNQSLQPERANTFSAGIVLQPSFIPGLAGSFDYWNVDIKDAITTLVAGDVVNQCAAGNATFCSRVNRNAAGVITTVTSQPINLARQKARGLDFELSYVRPMFGGTLRFRGLATRYLKNETNNGITVPIDLVGNNNGNGADATSLPKWSYNATLGFDRDPVAFQLTARGVSAGVLNTTYVQCSSNCPTSTVSATTIDDNHVAGAIYFDANVTVKVGHGVETFLSVDNIANKDPAQVAWAANGPPHAVNQSLYDVIGRTFRAGIRFKM
ncbi:MULTISPECIES: TonB-dependent receptor domain-containing protein [unclassified Sphingobium]|uniref:TonB-dependent receptor domain-containing protein n=1 Tax=unclassified Sphingobium TaxID=2611147 RepID=UPI0035A6F12D